MKVDWGKSSLSDPYSFVVRTEVDDQRGAYVELAALLVAGGASGVLAVWCGLPWQALPFLAALGLMSGGRR